jgi:electron transport complex protein RnfC
VLNTATVNAIYDAVMFSKPLIHRVVTITGDAVNKPGNYDVKLGTSLEHFVEQVGGLKDSAVKIISGGPMMGMAMPNLAYPITKTFSSVLALSTDDVQRMKTTACIRCGRCVNACPENLVPQLMMSAAVNDDIERFETLGGMECIECGCCTYVCPAKRPLTQNFKLAKAEVRASKSKMAEVKK